MRAADALSDVTIMRLLADARARGLDRPAAVRAVIAEAVRRCSKARRAVGVHEVHMPLVHAVVAETAARMFVSATLLLGNGQGKLYWRARRLAWYVLNVRFGVAHSDIGPAFGRERSGVSAVLAEWEDEIAADPIVGEVEAAVRARVAERKAA